MPRACCSIAPVCRPREIVAAGITNQRETTIVWERATGRPVAPAIVWQCRRTAAYCAELAQSSAAADITRRTGLVIDAYFSGSKIRWILDHVPGARQKARDGELLFGNVDTWLIWKLTNGAVHVTDVSNASRTMLMNLETGEWDDELLRIFDVPRAMLPRIVPSSAVVGSIAAEHFGAEIPIAGIAGDQQAALAGQACFRAGTLQKHIRHRMFRADAHRRPPAGVAEPAAGDARGIHRWPAAIRHRRQRVHRGRGRAVAARQAGPDPAPRPNPKRWRPPCPIPAASTSCRPSWAWARRTGTPARAASSAASPAPAAARTSSAPRSRASPTRPANWSKPCRPMPASASRELRVDGGAAANNFLMQFQADILGCPIVRPVDIETTALGAAYLAGLATGFWKRRGRGGELLARRTALRAGHARSHSRPPVLRLEGRRGPLPGLSKIS